MNALQTNRESWANIMLQLFCSSCPQTNALFCYENGNQATSWIRHTVSITNSFSTIYSISAADLDGDGDNDLIRTSGNGEVAIYQNQTILGVKKYASSNGVLVLNPA